MNHDDLIHRFLDGTASQAEAAELSHLIETDANVRNRYLDLAELHAVLSAEESLRAPRVEKRLARPKWVRFAPALKIAAALVVAGLAFWWLKPAAEPDLPFATLISTVNARWDDEATELSLNAGEAPSGMLRLLEGEAEFATSQGATVALEAPAVIQFESATAIFVESGKVLCRCPTPQSRLTVRTPETQVIDLGTEFSVEARGDRSTRVAVFSGEVKVDSTVLREGQAAEVRSPGLTMLEASVVREMMAQMRDDAPMPEVQNELREPDFADAKAANWELTPGHAKIEDQALRVSSRESRFWPNARQTVWRPDLSGRAIVASVRALQPADDPLQPMQFAVLKLVFRGERGSHIAYASRHFQFGGGTSGFFETAHVAAIAPPGTKGVSVELLLNARGEKNGSVVFDDAVLHIGPLKTPAAPQP
jgi:ferric-dicitrate binding protein FerR (iron transport regulator)